MLNFGISNMKRIKDSGLQEIKKINILVGKNSSGKSTYLRSFPLLKQSINTRTNAPILWFGDYVDFGDIKNSIYHHNTDEEVVFTFFTDSLERSNFARYTPLSFRFRPRHRKKHSIKDILYSVYIKIYDKTHKISKIKFSCIRDEKTEEYEIHVSEKKVPDFVDNFKISDIIFNKKSLNSYLIDVEPLILLGSIFPEIKFYPERTSRFLPYLEDLLARNFIEQFSFLKEVKEDELENFIHLMLDNGPTSLKEMHNLFKHKEFFLNPPIWEQIEDTFSKNSTLESTFFDDLNNIRVLLNMRSLLHDIANYLSPIMASSLYIGPARVNSNRYYRYQDLAVSEINPNGDNFPMFLNSLSKKELNEFSKWVEGIFGYGVNLNTESGHISIELTYEKDIVNIVDTGYGVSQILPILGQVWWVKRRKTRIPFKKNIIIAIEQPELHLHPAHQALLADVFVKGLDDNNNIRYIIETHSEALINRIGELIENKEINHKDVQVLVFEDDLEEKNTTKIKNSSFNEEGILENWPFGFFRADI